MKKILPLTITLLASTYTSSVLADDSWYLGTLYNSQDVSRHFDDYSTAGVFAGYKYNQYFSLEARVAKGASGFSSFYGTPEERKGRFKEGVDTQSSLSLKVSYPIFESFNIYALAGFINTSLKTEGIGQFNDENGNITGDFHYKLKRSDSGFSYGLGIAYQFNPQFGIFFDYQVLPDFEFSSYESRNWKSKTIGFSYHF